MKKVSGVLWVLAILLLFPNDTNAVLYRNKQIVLISINVNIHEQVREKLDALSVQFPEIDSKKGDKIISKILDYTWVVLKQRLEQETGMYILPVNTYGKQFDYNEYGYPNTSINKAIRRGTSKLYMRVDISIDPEVAESHGLSALNIVSKDSFKTESDSTVNKGFRPQVTIDFTSYSNKGILPLEKLTGVSVSPEPWLFDPAVLDGLVNTNHREEIDNLARLINEAITELIKKFPA
ncbi:MAG TPA: hypothetical protein PL017_07120 [Tenuifilaceae bacterium]|nr:hypothetical protein [Tenuifilaceae bacterium]HPE17125.1 hypothetical protein [Tenuifilaceae bacterium]HPJ45853.1 hypothetical protein [Tenuifilaceae bacterium]HPQ34116.1 hypothetical protein [Tenuifilaceae bacterium]HRX68694.1 hypothetical protein [Tenuifilaceae bacterium]